MKKESRGLLVFALLVVSGFMLLHHKERLTKAQQNQEAAQQAAWMTRVMMPSATLIAHKVQPPSSPIVISGPRVAPLPTPTKADLSRIPRYSDAPDK